MILGFFLYIFKFYRSLQEQENRAVVLRSIISSVHRAMSFFFFFSCIFFNEVSCMRAFCELNYYWLVEGSRIYSFIIDPWWSCMYRNNRWYTVLLFFWGGGGYCYVSVHMQFAHVCGFRVYIWGSYRDGGWRIPPPLSPIKMHKLQSEGKNTVYCDLQLLRKWTTASELMWFVIVSNEQ